MFLPGYDAAAGPLPGELMSAPSSMPGYLYPGPRSPTAYGEAIEIVKIASNTLGNGTNDSKSLGIKEPQEVNEHNQTVLNANPYIPNLNIQIIATNGVKEPIIPTIKDQLTLATGNEQQKAARDDDTQTLGSTKGNFLLLAFTDCPPPEGYDLAFGLGTPLPFERLEATVADGRIRGSPGAVDWLCREDVSEASEDTGFKCIYVAGACSTLLGPDRGILFNTCRTTINRSIAATAPTKPYIHVMF